MTSTQKALALGALLLLLGSSRRTQARSSASSSSSARTQTSRPDDARYAGEKAIVRALIVQEAQEQGLDPRLALALANIESGFDARALGDADWHKDRARYERVVPREHPYYDQPELWRSYGVFQLLAPYHVRGNEDPRNLLEVRRNVKQGVATFAKRLEQQGGNVARAVMAYRGALEADLPYQLRVMGRFADALAQEVMP